MMSITGIELSLLGIVQFLTLGIGSSFSVEWPPSLCMNYFSFNYGETTGQYGEGNGSPLQYYCLENPERVTGRKARGLQTEEIACKCQTFLSLLSGRREPTIDMFFFSVQS